ncbi:MAG: phosphoenolpyruvate hydrolase family protein [Planctomycetes bacterium]|nr:phosphoenolpyruvate hydrolase family protein [Planctomycetota bacterium]
MLAHTSCHGVQVGSSIERLAIEGPLEARAKAFKSIRWARSE